MPTPAATSLPAPDRRDLRLRGIARQVLRHGFSAQEVARALALAALEFTERDLAQAACVLGLPDDAISRVLTDEELLAALGGDPGPLTDWISDWENDREGAPEWQPERDDDELSNS